MLAQVSNGKLQLGGLLDKFKVDFDEYKEIIDSFNQVDLNSKKFKNPETGKANWDAIAKEIGDCDETALSYFKTLEDGNGTIDNQSASIEGLGQHLQAEGKFAGFAAFKTTLL